MVFTKDDKLPTEQELTVPELNVTASALHAGAFHLGKYCEEQSKEFMLCRSESNDPRKCLGEGKAVTACGIDFFKQVKKSCLQEFVQYQKCLIAQSNNFEYQNCRKTQEVFNACVKKHIGVERPHPYYYCEPKIHDSKRPKPPQPEYPVYDDVPVQLPKERVENTKPTGWGESLFS